MILGDLKHWAREKQAFHPVIQRAVEYIRGTDLANNEPGTYEMEGRDMFAIVQAGVTAPKAERKSEQHAKYIDIQYLVSGEEEVIMVARPSERNRKIVDELDTEKDYALYDDVENEMDICLKPGMFVVLFPDDLHRPNCSRTEQGADICKVVIKINKALLS